MPDGSLLGSAVGGAHYSGVDPVKERRLSLRRAASPPPHVRRPSATGSGGGAQARTAEEVHCAVLDDLRELYECRPVAQIFERRFVRKAVFEDTWVLCKGVHEIAPQFFALPRVYSKSTILARRVLSLPTDLDRLIFMQKQEYVLRITGSKRVVESIIHVDLDSEQRITVLVERWQGKEPPTHWGAYQLRRLNARVLPLIPWLSSAPHKT